MARLIANSSLMHTINVILIGLGAGVLVGLMGVGGGFIVVPALVYLQGMDQHVAQVTSLLMLPLPPPLGLGALWVTEETRSLQQAFGSWRRHPSGPNARSQLRVRTAPGPRHQLSRARSSDRAARFSRLLSRP